MPRHLRIFAWRLPHAALPVGAARVEFVRPGNVRSSGSSVANTQPARCAAAAALETLTHLFVECPVARRAWRWWRVMWLRLTPQASCHWTPALVVGQGAWRPSRQHALSGTTCASSCCTPCGRPGVPLLAPRPHSAAVVAALWRPSAAVSMDWRGSARHPVGTSLPFMWFRGRDPRIQPNAFKAKWCHRGVIALWKPPSTPGSVGTTSSACSSWGLGSSSGGSNDSVWWWQL